MLNLALDKKTLFGNSRNREKKRTLLSNFERRTNDS